MYPPKPEIGPRMNIVNITARGTEVNGPHTGKPQRCSIKGSGKSETRNTEGVRRKNERASLSGKTARFPA